MAPSRKPQLARKQPTFELLESRRVLATISGTVFEDVNGNGLRDATDPEIQSSVVYLDLNENGLLDQRGSGFDPDQFRTGETLNNVDQSVVASATGADNEPSGRVVATLNPSAATTGDHVFGSEESSTWTAARRLRFDFAQPVESISIDVAGASPSTSANVFLEAYNEAGLLLDTDSASGLTNGQLDQLSIDRFQPEISYVVAYPDGGEVLHMVTFDNLLIDAIGSEPSTLSSTDGFYRFVNVDEGPVTIAQVPPTGYTQNSPEVAHSIDLSASISNLNFANQTSSVAGVAFKDEGTLGLFEPGVDDLKGGTVLYLDTNRNGLPDQVASTVDPDSFLTDQVLEFASPDVRISVTNASNEPSSARKVTASTDTELNINGLVFAHEGTTTWNENNRLRFDFNTSASSVDVEFIAGSSDGFERGTIIAYSHADRVIDSATTRQLLRGQRETLSILRSGIDIAYIVAYTSDSPNDGEGRFDNFRASVVSEPVSVADTEGEYLFKPLEAGEYLIGALPVNGQSVSFPADSMHTAELALGEIDDELDFGFEITNDPPIARGDSITTLEDLPTSIGVLVNDLDLDGTINEGSILITQQPKNGTSEVMANGFVTYTPNENFNGRDTFIYTVQDDQAATSNSAVVVVDVTPTNDRPQANDDEVSLVLTGSTVIDVVANDTDVDGVLDRATVLIDTQPANGTVEVDPTTGNITYTTEVGGDDSFTYTVADDLASVSDVATVRITGLAAGVAPVAVDDTATTLEGTRINLQVLGNDTDDGTINPDSILIVTPPAQGEVEITSGRITYQPTLGFIGTDTFSYQVRDDQGIASNSATVSVEMTERDFPYQNPIDALDVNGDGFIVPRDVVTLINEINNRNFSNRTTGAITVPAQGRPANYYDINGDGFIVANDVIRLVNFLNRQTAAASTEATAAAEPDEAQSPTPIGSAHAVAVAVTFASEFDAFADDDEEAV